jgi:hypothetical protein
VSAEGSVWEIATEIAVSGIDFSDEDTPLDRRGALAAKYLACGSY